MFLENREYLEKYYERFNHICERKSVQTDIIVSNILEGRKKGYFNEAEWDIEFENKEEETRREFLAS
jgi:hypothetical protein